MQGFQIDTLPRSDDGPPRFRVRVPAVSPLFDGHFPGDPILPGVAQLVVLGNAVERMLGKHVELRAVDSFRLRQKVPAGADLILEIEASGALAGDDHGVRFTFRHDGSMVSTGRARFRALARGRQT